MSDKKVLFDIEHQLSVVGMIKTIQADLHYLAGRCIPATSTSGSDMCSEPTKQIHYAIGYLKKSLKHCGEKEIDLLGSSKIVIDDELTKDEELIFLSSAIVQAKNALNVVQFDKLDHNQEGVNGMMAGMMASNAVDQLDLAKIALEVNLADVLNSGK